MNDHSNEVKLERPRTFEYLRCMIIAHELAASVVADPMVWYRSYLHWLQVHILFFINRYPTQSYLKLVKLSSVCERLNLLVYLLIPWLASSTSPTYPPKKLLLIDFNYGVLGCLALPRR
jgi:hypothetical protein